MAYGRGRKKGISKTTVEDALRAAKEGREYEVRDSEVGGLSIRVRKTSASWTLRCRIKGQKGQSTLAIARVDLLKDVARAREIALQGKAKAAGGENPKDYFKHCLASEDDVEAEAKVRRGKGAEWTWEEAITEFLEAAARPGPDKKRPDTVKDYGWALRNPEARKRLNGKLLSTITNDDVRAVKDALLKQGKRRQAENTLGRIRQLFEFACITSGSGVRTSPAAGVTLSVFRKGRPGIEDAIKHAGKRVSKKRTLDDREVGLFLREVGKLDRVFDLALTLELFTVQRRATIVRAIKGAFEEDPEWGTVWVVDPGILKVGEDDDVEYQRPHALPLPERVADAARLAISMSRDDSPFLFPKIRPRYATDSRDGTMSLHTMNAKLTEIQKPGKPLHSARKWSNHSVRYTFVSCCGRLGISKDDRDLVMHHSEGSTKSVAEAHYQADPKMPNKQVALRKWHDYIMEMTEKYAKEDAEDAAA